MGSAGVPHAVFGVPPNTSRPVARTPWQHPAHPYFKTLVRMAGECGARRTAPRPGRSRSQIAPVSQTRSKRVKPIVSRQTGRCRPLLAALHLCGFALISPLQKQSKGAKSPRRKANGIIGHKSQNIHKYFKMNTLQIRPNPTRQSLS